MESRDLALSPQTEWSSASVGLVEHYRGQGITIVPFQDLNLSLESSGRYGFFHGWRGPKLLVAVLTLEPWANEHLIRLLNILLEIRVDPDPPGVAVEFHFHSLHPVPPLFATLFGSYRISPLECRAAINIQFGSNLQAKDCTRLAAFALSLVATTGLKTSFKDPNGPRMIQDWVLREVRALGLPQDGVPLNFLICLGCLYGEMVRSRASDPTEWLALKEYQPWPALVLRVPKTKNSNAPPNVLALSPIALTIQLSQGGDENLLVSSCDLLLDREKQESQGRGASAGSASKSR